MKGALLALLMLVSSRMAAAELLVYLPEAPAALVVQRTLEADPILAGVTIRVATRWRLFDEIQNQFPAAWAVVCAPVLQGGGWRPVLQGRRLGSTTFRYRLIALERQPGAPPIATVEEVLGVVQECAREEVPPFLAAGFPGLDLPSRHRLVAKQADLLQVLGLELVGCALVTPTQMAHAMSRFPGQIRVVAESLPVRLPVVAVRDPAQAGNAARLSGLAPASLAILGIDGWESCDGDRSPWRPGSP